MNYDYRLQPHSILRAWDAYRSHFPKDKEAATPGYYTVELADPVVSPAYTAGLEGTPNELKLKYLADNDFAALNGEELRQAIKGRIAAKDGSSLVGNMVSEGTTPRRLTDLIGSLCDLTSGSGDKGTPIVYIQGYFDNYTND